jgi:C4-dicarboxylate transporter DctQ subunit
LGFSRSARRQAVWQIITGEREMVIAAHEAEDLVAENKDVLKD